MAEQYAFPNISFSETLVGPIPFTTEYRNRIGIAGIFRRGPRGAARVTNRQDAAYLYGDDNSPGAVAVRQAILQGATDLVISRATPQPTAATLGLKFSNILPTNEAQIGYNGNIQQFSGGEPVQTTGLKLDVRYIGGSIETVRAAGQLNVLEASALSNAVSYNGLGLFEFVVEEYLEGGSSFVVAADLSDRSNTIAFDLATETTFTLSGSFALTNLTFVDAAPAEGEIYVLSNGMQITIDAGAVSATVTKNPTTVAAGTISAFELKTLQVSSLSSNLAAKSYLYFSNATFQLFEDAAPSNDVVLLKGVLSSTTQAVTISEGAVPEVQQIIASGGITADATYDNGGNLEEQVQWVYMDRTVTANSAMIANIKPGRLIYSSGSASFNSTSGDPLMVMSNPTDDLTNPNNIRFLVKGEIAANITAADVVLYETPSNLYVFSSTFRANSGNLPEYKKSPDATVTISGAAVDGASSITLASLPYRVDPGFTIVFTNGSRFTIDAQIAASASSVSVTGTLVGDVPDTLTGTLSDPMTYTLLQTGFEVSERNALVDCYVVAQEAAQANNFNHRLYYEREDGVVFSPASGIDFDLPAISTSNKIAFLTGGTFTVPVAYASVALGSAAGGTAFAIGTTASQILSDLKAAIELDTMMMGLLKEPELSTGLNPPTLTLETNYTGKDANRVRATVTRETAGTSESVSADDFLFNASNVADSASNYGATLKFTGAVSGSQAAYRDFYSIDSDPLLRVVALSEGDYGNKLKITVTPQSDGQFSLFVVDEDSASYQNTPGTETMTLSTRDVATDGLFNASGNSRLVRCYYLPAVDGRTLTETELDKVPMRLAPSYGDRIPIFNNANQATSTYALPLYAQAASGQSYLQNVYLEGGQDAAVTSLPAAEKAKILRKAVQQLEGADIAILYCAGFDAADRNYSSVIEEMSGQVNRANVMTGLRVAVVQAPRNLSQTQALALASSLDNPRVVLVGGHTSMQGVPGYNNTPAAGFYAGLLAANPPEFSPASVGEGMVPNGVVSVDTPATTGYLDAVTRARTEALYYDAGIGAYKFLNGISTTSKTSDRYISIRRTADQILHDLYSNLIWVRSNRNTPALRSRVAVAVDAYLQRLMRDGRISSYRNTICNESNNTPTTISQGILNIAIYYTPVYPADFIRVNVTREVADSLSLQTQ